MVRAPFSLGHPVVPLVWRARKLLPCALKSSAYADLICAKDGTDYYLTTVGNLRENMNIDGQPTKEVLDSMCSPCSLKMFRILARVYIMIDSGDSSNEMMAMMTSMMKAMCAKDADDSYCALTPAGQNVGNQLFGPSSDSSDPDAPPDWNLSLIHI